MSLGFSVSDFIGVGRMALKLYDEFREAPGACEAFAKDLLLFHQVVLKTGSLLENKNITLGVSDRASLKACVDSCKQLIYVQIYGATDVPSGVKLYENVGIDTTPLFRGPNGDDRFLRGWRQKWGEKKFSMKIPKLQVAVAAHTEKLTAFNVLLVQSKQVDILASQGRLETSQTQTKARFEEGQTSLENSHTRLEAASERLEKAHIRMETQLQKILVSQQQQNIPLLSHSLDASSPEGRETWMNLGRLLRAEGITPMMIKQNRDLLVKAMKTTLHEDPPPSAPESYRTASESFSGDDFSSSTDRRKFKDTRSAISSSTDLFGSAPVRGVTFTDEFLKRPKVKAHSLDQRDNVEDGMRSLLRGMGADNVGFRDEDEKDAGVPQPGRKIKVTYKYIASDVGPLSIDCLDLHGLTTVPFDGIGRDPSTLVGFRIQGFTWNQTAVKLKTHDERVMIKAHPEHCSSDAEILVDDDLRVFFVSSNNPVAKEGLLITNAAVGTYRAPHRDHRIIGLKCEGMEEMGWIFCAKRLGYHDVDIMQLSALVGGDVAISVDIA